MDKSRVAYISRPVWEWVALSAVGVAHVFGIIYYFFFAGGNGYDLLSGKETTTSELTEQGSADASIPIEQASLAAVSNKIISTPVTPADTSKLSYDEARALSLYRFQFDNNCSGGTASSGFGSLNVKQGANIMFENHGDTSHVIALGTNAHTIAAGGFVVITAPKVTTTTGMYITCDDGGAGNVFVNS